MSAPDVGGRAGRGVHGRRARGVDARVLLHHAAHAGRLQDLHAGAREGTTQGRAEETDATEQAAGAEDKVIAIYSSWGCLQGINNCVRKVKRLTATVGKDKVVIPSGFAGDVCRGYCVKLRG